jgi:hypothetical protein
LDLPLCRIEFASTLALIDRYFTEGMKDFDVGGGPGRYTIELIKRGCKVTLLDLSAENSPKAGPHTRRRKICWYRCLSRIYRMLVVYSRRSPGRASRGGIHHIGRNRRGRFCRPHARRNRRDCRRPSRGVRRDRRICRPHQQPARISPCYRTLASGWKGFNGILSRLLAFPLIEFDRKGSVTKPSRAHDPNRNSRRTSLLRKSLNPQEAHRASRLCHGPGAVCRR